LGQDKVAAAAEAEKKAKSDIEAAKKAQEAAELKMKLYKAFIGLADADERKSIQSPGTHAEALKEEHGKLMKNVDDNIRTSVNKVAGEPDGKKIEELQGRFVLGSQEVFQWPWPPQGVLAEHLHRCGFTAVATRLEAITAVAIKLKGGLSVTRVDGAVES